MSRLSLSGTALFVALLVSWPAIQHGVIDGTLPLEDTLIRVGIAIALAMIAQAVLGSVIDSFRVQNLARQRQKEASANADDEAHEGT